MLSDNNKQDKVSKNRGVQATEYEGWLHNGEM